MVKRVLLIGPNSVHLQNYIDLIQPKLEGLRVICGLNGEAVIGAKLSLDFGFKSVNAHLNTAKQIAEVIREFNPDVVHVHQANSYAYHTAKALLKEPKPFVITSWGSDVLLLSKKPWYIQKLCKTALKKAHVFTADSENLGAETLKAAKAKTDKLLVSNFGINPIIPTEKENIIYSNRQHKPLYRIDEIIKGFARFVKSQKQDWQLVVGAIGEETTFLKKLTIDLNIKDEVEFVGWLNAAENASYYAKSKVYISIPESDGTSVSLLEAMSAGCLPIVSNLAANKEWVKHLENGYIVSNINENFIESALALNGEEIAQINLNIIKERASIEAAQNNFIKAYEKAMEVYEL